MRKYLLTTLISGMLFVVAAVPTMAIDYVTIVIQQGDTLAKVAQRYCSTWQEIYSINREAIGDNPDLVFSGTVITVPNRCGSGTGTGVYDRGPSTYASGTVQNGIYTVAWGDTMFSIGQRFGVTLDNLRAANGFAEDQARIYAGTRLIVPGLGGTGTGATSPTGRTFVYGQCSVQVYVGATLVDTPGGRVLEVLGPDTYTALRVTRIGATTWYQLENILDTTGWIVNTNEGGMQELGFIGDCALLVN